MSQSSTDTETSFTKPIKCQATFKNQCHYPKCDCDRVIDPLVARDCVVMDGACNCKRNPNGGIPDECKYLTHNKK